MERLSCEDVVIKHVMDQVLTGYTENGYSGSEVIDEYKLSTELQQARENLRKKGNRLLVKEVNRLREVLDNRTRYHDNGWDEYHKLSSKVYKVNNDYKWSS